VIANLLTLEIKSGSNWTTQTRLSGPLILSAPGGVPMPGSTNGFNPGLTTTELKSHQSAYATIHFSGSPVPPSLAPGAPGLGMNFLAGQPTGAVWRLSVNVQEKVTGLSDASTRLTHYPDTRARLATAGVTNAPLNPFSAGYSYFGKPTKVTIAEVSREGTVDQ
jgi:hypothetical protein